MKQRRCDGCGMIADAGCAFGWRSIMVVVQDDSTDTGTSFTMVEDLCPFCVEKASDTLRSGGFTLAKDWKPPEWGKPQDAERCGGSRE